MPGEGGENDAEVVVLSSDSSEDNEMNGDGNGADEPHGDADFGMDGDDFDELDLDGSRVLEHQSSHSERFSVSSAESKVVQRTMWDYVGYVADSESSMNSEKSTSSTARKPVRQVLMEVVRPKRVIQPNRRPPRPPKRNVGSSSCSSSNKFG